MDGGASVFGTETEAGHFRPNAPNEAHVAQTALGVWEVLRFAETALDLQGRARVQEHIIFFYQHYTTLSAPF
jgi:hypothetical protein